MTVHHFGPIYPTEIIAIVQCMNAGCVVWDGGSGGLDFFNGGIGSFNGKGQVCLGRGNQTTQCRPNV